MSMNKLNIAPPQLEGHSYSWQLKPYEEDISRGTCQACGAVWFFANNWDNDVIKKASELNKQFGKEGSYG